jgi:hypothetical protein
MKVQAIRTDKGNFLANYNGYFFFVGSNRKTPLRMSNASEFENALANWGQVEEPLHISKIREIIELSAMSAKIGCYVDSMSKADLSQLYIENFREEFSYVNNDFNYVVGFYANGEYQKFSPKCGKGTLEYGNFGTPTSWDGETYVETLQRFIAKTSTYPEVMVVKNSNHDSRQGDRYKSEIHAYVLPSQEAIEAFFGSVLEAYETLKKMPTAFILVFIIFFFYCG